MTVRHFLALPLLASALLASNTPLPNSLYSNDAGYLGLARQVAASTSTWQGGYAAAGGGGSFTGSIQNKTGTTLQPAIATALWCVDSQLTFSSTNNAQANIIRLADVDNTSIEGINAKAATRYANISAAGGGLGQWRYDLGAGFNDAKVRFSMAAYLIQNAYVYDPLGQTAKLSNSTLAIRNQNDAVQRAIWAIMLNGPTGGTDFYSNATVQSWITQAKSSFSQVDTSKWAVVTWDVDPLGNFQGPGQQTFLVEVVPEPGFYGALALGLSGLVVAVRRRKNTNA